MPKGKSLIHIDWQNMRFPKDAGIITEEVFVRNSRLIFEDAQKAIPVSNIDWGEVEAIEQHIFDGIETQEAILRDGSRIRLRIDK